MSDKVIYIAFLTELYKFENFKLNYQNIYDIRKLFCNMNIRITAIDIRDNN